MTGREFRDQRSRQYPSRSRSFGRTRNKKKEDDEEEPSAAVKIQRMLAGGASNPMIALMSPTTASMTGVGGMAPGTGLDSTAAAETPSKVLVLSGAVTVDELKDDEEYGDLFEDMKLEAEKHGVVSKLEIPRPVEGQDVAGLGKIYVVFELAETAARAKKVMDGRKFGDAVVSCAYLDESKFSSGER